MSDATDRIASALEDRYRVDREIGRGGMATVYLAEDLKHQRKVAIKVLRPELAATLGAERFLREIRVTANLHHPHMLPLYDSGRAGDFLFYVMPHVEGESLRERMDREKQLSIADALQITRELADGLGHAHSLGIVHRDIKPENILFQAGHALLADFGIARAISVAGVDQLTETGFAVGTPTYMSPEQATGGADIDARSDIYSLACVLFEMLAGDPPFVASNPQALLARKSVESVPALTAIRDTVPSHVETALLRALSRVPADRFPTAHEFFEALAISAEPDQFQADRSAIAVLPFVNMSADPENEYFSDGITEEVINVVAGVPNLRVTARTSAFQFKDKEYDIREIGRKLSVGTVLEGSVRKAGDRVRVTAQLIDVNSGFHLWSERFDRDLEDVFAIQDEIAEAIAKRLEKEIGLTTTGPTKRAPVDSGPTRPNLSAYDEYLQGRFHRQRMLSGPDAIEKAEACYRKAIALDPNFALAHSALAELQIVLSIGFAAKPGRELLPKAKESAESALQLDPALPQAHLACALVAMYYEWDYATAKAGIDRALKINPNFVDAHFWAEFYWTYVERDFEQAVAANNRAAELDPLDLNIRTRLSQVLLLFGHYDEAIDQLESVIETDKDFMVAWVELADGYSQRGDHEKAAAAADRAIELSGRAVATLGVGVIVFAQAGNVSKARDLLRELTDRSRNSYVFPFWLAAAHAGLGQMDAAFDYLDQAVEDRDAGLLFVPAVPQRVGWLDDPRYPKLLERIGLGHLADRQEG